MFFIVVLIILGLIVAFLLWGAKLSHDTEKQLKESGFTPNVDLLGLCIDEEHGLWNKRGMDMTFSFSEIIDCEVVEDGVSYKSDNGVLRAVVGGALFGAAGAIVGAMTSSSSERVHHLSVCIHTSNATFNKVTINLISQPTPRNSSNYRSSLSAAETMVKIIDKYSGFSEKKQLVTPENTALPYISKADELSKYKKLLNEGAITEDEYSKIKERFISDVVEK